MIYIILTALMGIGGVLFHIGYRGLAIVLLCGTAILLVAVVMGTHT